MIQGGRAAGLLDEACLGVSVEKSVRGDNLQRDIAAQLAVVRDISPSRRRQLLDDAILAECLADQ